MDEGSADNDDKCEGMGPLGRAQDKKGGGKGVKMEEGRALYFGRGKMGLSRNG